MKRTSSATPPQLFKLGDADDSFYCKLRDYAEAAAHRQFIEALWRDYYPFADRNFLIEIRKHFHQRFWEMYLTCTLLTHGASSGYKVECPMRMAGSPDVLIELDGQRIWIEATAPTTGEPSKPDSVRVESQGFQEVPEEAIILRYCQAIHEKAQKVARYIQKGVVGNADAYVVAVNGAALPFAYTDFDDLEDPELPRIAQALYPIGSPAVLFASGTRQCVARYPCRPAIKKACNSEVSTEIFLDRRYDRLSAVLYSRVGFTTSAMLSGACPTTIARGSDFLVFHNPSSSNPIPLGVLPAAWEYEAKLNPDAFELVRHRGTLGQGS